MMGTRLFVRDHHSYF